MRSISALDNTERQALEDALEDEYKAHTTYAQVIQDLGAVLPFLNIVDAETRHVSALLSLFEKCGIAAPPNRWPGKVPRFSSVEEACAAAVQGEINNVALYDRVLKLPGGPTSSPFTGPCARPRGIAICLRSNAAQSAHPSAACDVFLTLQIRRTELESAQAPIASPRNPAEIHCESGADVTRPSQLGRFVLEAHHSE